MCVFSRNVDFAEKMVVHKPAIALVVVPSETTIFVQVDGGDGGKIQITVFIHGHQIFIQTDRGRACGQPQNTVWFFDYLRSNNIGCLAA